MACCPPLSADTLRLFEAGDRLERCEPPATCAICGHIGGHDLLVRTGPQFGPKSFSWWGRECDGHRGGFNSYCTSCFTLSLQAGVVVPACFKCTQIDLGRCVGGAEARERILRWCPGWRTSRAPETRRAQAAAAAAESARAARAAEEAQRAYEEAQPAYEAAKAEWRAKIERAAEGRGGI